MHLTGAGGCSSSATNGQDICSCPHLGCSQYRSSHLLWAITYNPQPKSFTGTLQQTIFLDRHRRREGTAITNTPKAKSRISRQPLTLLRFTQGLPETVKLLGMFEPLYIHIPGYSAIKKLFYYNTICLSRIWE